MQEIKQKENEYENLNYQLEGQVGGSVGALVGLVIMVGVAVLILIFVGSLSGQTYNLVESDITSITNVTVRNHVNGAIISGFSALEQTGDYMPILVLAFIIALVLSLVLGFASLGGGAGRGGTAL